MTDWPVIALYTVLKPFEKIATGFEANRSELRSLEGKEKIDQKMTQNGKKTGPRLIFR
jgi:hypothetical protein